MVSHVRIREVYPKTNPLGERFPLLHVPPNRFLTAVDERLDSVRLDLGFRVNPEFLAYLNLDGQAMGVPARLPLAVFAAHRAVAGIEILDRAREAVPGMRHSVGGRRALEKNKPLGPLSLVERLGVGAVLAPQSADRSFDFWEVWLAADGFKHDGGGVSGRRAIWATILHTSMRERKTRSRSGRPCSDSRRWGRGAPERMIVNTNGRQSDPSSGKRPRETHPPSAKPFSWVYTGTEDGFKDAHCP